MPCALLPGHQKRKIETYIKLMLPMNNTLSDLTDLTSGCNRPLQMTFEDQINILVYFHLEEHHSGRHLLQVLKENHFARQYIAPEKGIQKSSFFEDISSRGLEQMVELFGKLYIQAAKQIPKGYAELGDLVSIDGSLIDAVLSMCWADYRDNAKKAKVHVGFDLNRGIPKKIFLTDGKDAERPFVRRFWRRGKRALWTEATSATSSLTSGRQRASILSLGLKHPQKRTSSERMMFNPAVTSFMTPLFCWEPQVSIRRKGKFV